MKRTKIAPTLQRFVAERACGQTKCKGESACHEAAADLRALLAVARAAERWGQETYTGDRLPGPGHSALTRAILRLRRLSAPERDAKRATRKGAGR